MRYFPLVLCLALSALLALNMILSIGAALAWRTGSRALARLSPATLGVVLFWLRTLPSLGSLVSVGILVVPAYLAYEQWPPDDVISPKLVALSALSATGVLLAVFRKAASFLKTRRLTEVWMRTAVPIRLNEFSWPAYRVACSFPVVAVVGVRYPRLFIAEHVLEALTADEVSAVVCHEAGHVASRDNFKRVLMDIGRDLLPLPRIGRFIDDSWGDAVEAAADEYAARSAREMALNLASAIIKVARLVPSDGKVRLPIASYLVRNEAGIITRRVKRLMELAQIADNPRVKRPAIHHVAAWASPAAIIAALTYSAASTRLLEATHLLIERVFEILT